MWHTRVIWEEPAPAWNEEKEFEVPDTCGDLSLRAEVFDVNSDKSKGDHFVGQARTPRPPSLELLHSSPPAQCCFLQSVPTR